MHGFYAGSAKMTLRNAILSYHTFYKFALARLLHSDEWARASEADIQLAKKSLETLLTTELYPKYIA